jgi:hypothetical protein
MPISGAKHAINFQSFKERLFERPEKNFACLVRRDFAPNRARRPRTLSAQRKTCSCVRMVRQTPKACIHPINAINSQVE